MSMTICTLPCAASRVQERTTSTRNPRDHEYHARAYSAFQIGSDRASRGETV